MTYRCDRYGHTCLKKQENYKIIRELRVLITKQLSGRFKIIQNLAYQRLNYIDQKKFLSFTYNSLNIS